MKHIMMDILGIKNNLISVEQVNEMINTAISKLNLKAVMPAENTPYFYCDDPNDGGVSSYCILDGGHITAHSFPFYGVCYIDIMFDDIDEEKANTLFNEIFNPEQINTRVIDRDTVIIDKTYSPETDFGPHLFAAATLEKPFDMNTCYSILESTPEKIDMHPITRPRVITNKLKNYDTISGIILIAESHISIHSNIKTGKVYFDVYSCKFCPVDKLKSVVFDIFGKECNFTLISRGSKPEKAISESFTMSYNGWKENVL